MSDDAVVKKARDLIAKAEKKEKSWFAAMSGSKWEDAEELYTKAANQLKVAKACAWRACAARPSAHAVVRLATAPSEAPRCVRRGRGGRNLPKVGRVPPQDAEPARCRHVVHRRRPVLQEDQHAACARAHRQ